MTDQLIQRSAEEVNTLLQSSTPPVLLDCREPEEWEYCRIEGAVHMPMNEIPLRISELDPDSEIIVYCHHGIRSASVCVYLQQMDFDHVANLSGGIDAWSKDVDPSVPLY